MARVRKQLLAPATYWVLNPRTREPEPFDITPEDIDHFTSAGRAMLAAGVKIPVPLEHQEDVNAEEIANLSLADRLADTVLHNSGWVADYGVDADGIMWTDLDVEDPKVADKLNSTIKYVSPQIDPSLHNPKTGEVWRNVITHVALTPRPIFTDQQPGFVFLDDSAVGFGTPRALSQGNDLGGLRLSFANLWYAPERVARKLAHEPAGATVGKRWYPEGSYLLRSQVPERVRLSEFDESKIRRDEDGKFASTGGSKPSKTSPARTPAAKPPPHLAPVPGALSALAEQPKDATQPIAGWPVQNAGSGLFKIQTDRGTVHGDSDRIMGFLAREWQDQEPDRKRIDAALERVQHWTAPSWFSREAEEESRKINALPKGARVVSFDGDTKGRIGSVVKKDGSTLVKWDNSPGEWQVGHIEPLDAKQSWRKAEEEKPAEKTYEQRMLFSQKGEAGGQWITIGGQKGEDGKRKGGSPVFVKDGRIVKGHPSLTGKKISALKEEGEDKDKKESREHVPSMKAELEEFAKKELDPAARRLLQNPDADSLLSKVPAGSKRLPHGSTAIAWETPDGDIVRIGPLYERPSIPEVLQPSSTTVHGNHMLERLPKADMRNVSQADMRSVQQKLKSRGYELTDTDAGNIGRLPDGRVVVTDPDAVEKIGSPSVLNIWKNAEELAAKHREKQPEKDEYNPTHRQQLNQGKGYSRAVMAKQARKEGINPQHLHQMAADLLEHDKAFKADRTKFLQTARKQSESLGYGSLNNLKQRMATGKIDSDSLQGLDEIADSLAATYPEHFAGHDDPQERLFDLLSEGNPEPMSEEEAYEQALEYLRENKAPELEEASIPFSQNSTSAPGLGKPMIPLQPHHWAFGRQAANGKNPPAFAANRDQWEQARRKASKNLAESDGAYWPAVTAIYESLGGAIQGKTRMSLQPEKKMAKEDLYEADEKETPDEEETPTPPVEPVDLGNTEIKEASAELAEMGIMVPESKNPREFLEHLCTALKTHKATKGANEMADKKPEQPAAQPKEEPAMVQMSHRLKSLEANNKKLSQELADTKHDQLCRLIDSLVSNGQTSPALAEKWKNVLGGKKLSLVAGDDAGVSRVLDQIDFAEDVPEGSYWTSEQKTARLSQAQEETRPDWAVPGKDAHGNLSPEKVQELLDWQHGKAKTA